MNPLALSSIGLSAAAAGNDSQSELQQRILSILNAGNAAAAVGLSSAAAAAAGGVPAPVPVPHPAAAAAAAGTTVPSWVSAASGGADAKLGSGGDQGIQKALDSLIQNGPGLMKNFPSQRSSLGGGGGGSGTAGAGHLKRPMQQGNYYQNKRF